MCVCVCVQDNIYILFCCFYRSSPTIKTAVKMKLKHEIGICSVVGMILKIYKCWENSGRKIIVVH